MNNAISLIIPTLNASLYIKDLISSIQTQTLKPAEIIVIDSSSDDDTVSIAQEMGCKTIVIFRKQFNHGLTRNLATEHAKGEILIFMTQDAMPQDNHLLEKLTKSLNSPSIAASYARQIPYDNSSPIEKFARSFNYPATTRIKSMEDIQVLGIKTFSFSNVCSAIKKIAFAKAGGFPRIIMNEDMIFASKLILKGYKVAYEASARIIHSHDYSLTQQFRRYFDIGISLRDNNILEYAKPSGEGKRFIAEGIKHFLKQKKPEWIFYLILDAFFRYTGYFCGLRYTAIPMTIRKWLSMHS